MEGLKDLRKQFEKLELLDDSEFLPVGTTLVMGGIPYKQVGRAMTGDHKLVRWIKSKRAWAKTPQIWIGKGARA